MWSQQNSSAAIHVPILLHSIIIALIARTQIGKIAAEADQEEEEAIAAVAISAVRNNQTKPRIISAQEKEREISN